MQSSAVDQWSRVDIQILICVAAVRTRPLELVRLAKNYIMANGWLVSGRRLLLCYYLRVVIVAAAKTV